MCNESLTLLLECSFTKPPVTVVLLDKPTIVKAVALHYLILKSKAEIDQLKKGLATLGVLNAIELHPLLFEPLFIASQQTALTPGVCVCVSVCSCVCVCVRVHMCMFASVCMYIHMYLCILYSIESIKSLSGKSVLLG